MLLALGFAVHDLHGFLPVDWYLFALLIFCSILLQGIFPRSYPLFGEWLILFPFLLICCLGTYFVLTGSFHRAIVWASTLHGVLCTACLMQLHMMDISAELPHETNSNTTVAFVGKHYGLDKMRYVPVAYFLLAALLGIFASFCMNPIFVFSVLTALLGGLVAWQTNPWNVANVTYNQVKMIVLALLHTIFLFGIESLL